MTRFLRPASPQRQGRRRDNRPRFAVYTLTKKLSKAPGIQPERAAGVRSVHLAYAAEQTSLREMPSLRGLTR